MVLYLMSGALCTPKRREVPLPGCTWHSRHVSRLVSVSGKGRASPRASEPDYCDVLLGSVVEGDD